MYTKKNEEVIYVNFSYCDYSGFSNCCCNFGADTTSVVVALAPMGFVLAKKAKFHPLLVTVGVGAFAAVGSGFSWSAS